MTMHPYYKDGHPVYKDGKPYWCDTCPCLPAHLIASIVVYERRTEVYEDDGIWYPWGEYAGNIDLYYDASLKHYTGSGNIPGHWKNKDNTDCQDGTRNTRITLSWYSGNWNVNLDTENHVTGQLSSDHCNPTGICNYSCNFKYYVFNGGFDRRCDFGHGVVYKCDSYDLEVAEPA